jgi:hypothetical protein
VDILQRVSLVRVHRPFFFLNLLWEDRETAIVREEGETPNDRNDRGIRVATAWYNTHITLTHPPIRGQTQKPLPTVILLTEDAANRQKADQAGITSISGFVFGTHSAIPPLNYNCSPQVC